MIFYRVQNTRCQIVQNLNGIFFFSLLVLYLEKNVEEVGVTQG